MLEISVTGCCGRITLFTRFSCHIPEKSSWILKSRMILTSIIILDKSSVLTCPDSIVMIRVDSAVSPGWALITQKLELSVERFSLEIPVSYPLLSGLPLSVEIVWCTFLRSRARVT